MVKGFDYKVWVHLYYIFSYTTLLLLRCGDRARRTHTAQDFVEENNTSIQEAKCLIDIGLFLDKYPRWELATPHRTIILHEMFLHVMDRGWKVGRANGPLGHHSSVHDPSSKVDQSSMELVGHHTSRWEMRDIYQSIYLLRRTPGLPPCSTQSRKRVIWDILSSLEDQLCRCGHFTSIRNLGPKERQAGPNRRGSCEEALRVACQRALDTTKALRSNIKRLRQRRGRSRSHSRHCSHSRSHSRDCSWSRSQSMGHSRAQSQHCLQGNLWNVHPISPEGHPPGRRVTFRNPEAEMSSEGGTESYSMEPSVSDVET